jgi:L-asparaginase
LRAADVIDAVSWARQQIDLGCAGVVIAQGTDTLEETSYLAELLWDRDEPLVFTGAMRGPAKPSSDGVANILASTRAAVTAGLRGAGVTVILDDTIHLASRVRKNHSFSLSAFESPNGGPIGVVVENQVRLGMLPHRRGPISLTESPRDDIFVPLIETFFDDDGSLLTSVVNRGASGVVIAAFGAGHLSLSAAEVVSEVSSQIPIVVSTRTGRGGTLSDTYGFPGSETDLVRRGALLSGELDARKARILLWLLASSAASSGAIAAEFLARSQS